MIVISPIGVNIFQERDYGEKGHILAIEILPERLNFILYKTNGAKSSKVSSAYPDNS